MCLPQSSTVFHGFPQFTTYAKTPPHHHTTTVFLWGVGSVCGSVGAKSENTPHTQFTTVRSFQR